MEDNDPRRQNTSSDGQFRFSHTTRPRFDSMCPQLELKLQETIWDNIPQNLRQDVNLIKAAEVHEHRNCQRSKTPAVSILFEL